MNDIIIRPEQAEDFHNTELMTMRSFWNKYFPGCVEHNMLRVIRASADYLPEISRVAEKELLNPPRYAVGSTAKLKNALSQV